MDGMDGMDGMEGSIPELSKYERVQLLATRVEQLNRGAATRVKWTEGVDDTYTIAVRELEEGKMPIRVKVHR